MAESPKDKYNADIVYALADYKQMVLTYQTKHAELLRLVGFWKASVIWLGVATAILAVAAAVTLGSNRRVQLQSSQDIDRLTVQLKEVSQQLEKTRHDLVMTQEELGRRDAAIKHLQENVSTASKKLLEKLLSEENAGAAPGQ